MDENGVVRPSRGTHDAALVDVLDIVGLHSESVDNDGEVRYLPTILLESFGAFDGVSVFMSAKAVLKVLDSGSTSGSDCLEISAVLKLLRCKSFRKSTIPSCLGCGQCLINVFLGIVSLLSQGSDEGFVSVFMVDGVTQLADSRASDVLGQGSNGFVGESVFPVVDRLAAVRF